MHRRLSLGVILLMFVGGVLEAPRAAGISFIIVNDVEAVDHLGDIELEAMSRGGPWLQGLDNLLAKFLGDIRIARWRGFARG